MKFNLQQIIYEYPTFQNIGYRIIIWRDIIPNIRNFYFPYDFFHQETCLFKFRLVFPVNKFYNTSRHKSFLSLGF